MGPNLRAHEHFNELLTAARQEARARRIKAVSAVVGYYAGRVEAHADLGTLASPRWRPESTQHLLSAPSAPTRLSPEFVRGLALHAAAFRLSNTIEVPTVTGATEISSHEYDVFRNIETRINACKQFKQSVPIPVLRSRADDVHVELQFFDWANTAALTALRDTAVGLGELFLWGVRSSRRRKAATKMLSVAFGRFMKVHSGELSAEVKNRLILCLDDFVAHASPHLGADDRYVIVGRVAEIAEAQEPMIGEIAERMKKKIMRLRRNQ